MKQACEVETSVLGCYRLTFNRLARYDEFCVAYDVVERFIAHLSKILANLLCQEAEVVDEVVIVAAEVGAELRILCCNTHRTCVEVALAHHHAAKNNQGSCSE